MSKEVNQNSYSLKDHELSDALKRIYLTALHLNFPIAMWRLPLEDRVSLVVDLSGSSKQKKAELEEIGQGFIAVPFKSNGEITGEFISADLTFDSEERNLKVNPLFTDSWTTELFFQRVNASGLSGPEEQQTAHELPVETNKDDYLNLVQKGIDEIHHGAFKKVVLSRAKIIDLPQDFDVIDNFLALSGTYPGAFINFFQIPGKGQWLGATPELLISQDKEGFFKTVSLAGTQVAQPDANPLDIGWTQKEIEEQAMVGRYIINCFKKIRLREFEEDGPKTVRAANLFHLKSEYTVNTEEVNFPELGTVMLQLLHPTSAVCGMPKEPSMEFIEAHEGYDRSFYAGFLGPVNFAFGSALFVNLRCLQVMGNKGVLYAGGGITAHSNPDKEWHETEMKCRTILDIIS